MTFRRLLVCFSFFVLIAAVTAFAQTRDGVELRVEHNLAKAYAPGSEHDLWVRIELVDPQETVDVGVLFLNVVENDEAGRFPQAMHLVFASATELHDGEAEADRFVTPLDGEALRAGVEARVRVRLRARAPAGSYSIVFQLFEGEETDPHRVQIENRVAMWSHRFEVVP